ncbi:SIMPL domain-containing protein [Mycobacterium sp. M26]|uniref:SIMPL domain-containing protein n=1 Tax=Mycobacterium sp. M26 TaxID=1762962 RepID=UPI00073F20DC|nr:SIMPL domain-containing protein [Mycobacterium sp. M26]
MSDVEIHVRGAHSVTVPPERGTVHVTLALEGPAPEPVFRAVSSSLAEVKATLEARHHPDQGPVTRYSVDQVRMGSHRPWHKDGKKLPLVHSASVTVEATFADFDALAAWVASAAGVEGLSISYLDWELTDSRRLALERATRQHAVQDARRRAQDYADALELGAVTVRSVSDPGLNRPAPAPRAAMLAQAAPPGGGAEEFALRPQDVEVSAEVEATFVVAEK